MKRLFFLALLVFSSLAKADLVLAPRYEYIQGQEEELANRFILKGKLNATAGPFGIYAEGFGEYEMNEDQAFIRRSPSRGYLQEAYMEFKLESFFVRVGRQALRWSESWTLPSLDIWTGRRWNRLFFDPFEDQLTHSTGASFTYATEVFSLELVGIGELAENDFPQPIPEVENEENTSFGGRAKWNVGGFAFSFLSAQVLKKYYYGGTANYAFDHAVPKVEVGYSNDTGNEIPGIKKERLFGLIGVDLFLGNWVILPQLSYFETGDITGNETQTSFYLTAQWNPDRHDLHFQVYQNPKAEDSFLSVTYGYNLTDYFTAAIFAQNYEGNDGLYKIYEDITGGFVAGLRLQLTGNLPF
ncbi:hypothetical protein [Bdellovibrio bacteriovorus]|uniref:hypothetical protein n=1 Tax=Bdellovibrio bacteriovorus TaxID=959 RepID=UPI0035A5D07C